MLDREVRDLARGLIETALRDRNDNLQAELRQKQSEMASRGLSESSIAAGAYARVCAGELRIRAEIIFSEMRRVLAAARIETSDTLAQDIKNEVFGYVSDQEGILVAALSNATGGMRGVERLSQLVAESEALATRRVAAEVDLYVQELRSVKLEVAPSAGHTFSVSGANVVIQTGDFSHVELRSSDVAAVELIGGVLEEIRDELRTQERVGGVATSELVELIEEVKREMAKPRPNRVRLGALTAGLGGAIRTVASLRPAYETLRDALLGVGISLP